MKETPFGGSRIACRFASCVLAVAACGSPGHANVPGEGERTEGVTAGASSGASGQSSASSGGSVTSSSSGSTAVASSSASSGAASGSSSSSISASSRYTGPVVAGVWRDITPSQIADPSSNPCTALQFDPSNHSTLYGLFGNAGMWKSTDSGVTWAQIGNLPMPYSLGRILIDPNDPTHLYTTGSVGGSALGFWVSHDGGSTWAMPPAFVTGAATMWNTDVYNLVADPTDFNHIVMTFHNGWPCCGNSAGVVESKDGGQTYITHMPAAGMDHGQGIAFLYNPALNIGNANTWLVGAGYGAGLYRTTDAGSTWTQVDMLQENHGGFDAHYSAQGYLYIGGFNGVYRSTDNGVTWTQVTMGLSGNPYYSVIGDGHFLYTSPGFVGNDYNTTFFVTPEGGQDEGQQWTAYSTQVIPEGPWMMVFDDTNRIIYNAAWGSGAWALNVK